MNSLHSTATAGNEIGPSINVTPLIDILLVLLIIFMVIAPLRPARFKARLPQNTSATVPYATTLVVTVNSDLTLKLNAHEGLGTIADPAPLTLELERVFEERKNNHVWAAHGCADAQPASEQCIEKTVFLKAPRTLRYGEIAKLIDVLAGAGASPVGIQLDGLD